VAKANLSIRVLRSQSSSQHKPAKKTPSKNAKKPAIQSQEEQRPFTVNSSEANVALAMVGYTQERGGDDYLDTYMDFEVSSQFDLLVKERFGVSYKDYKGKHDLLEFAVSCYEAGRLAAGIRSRPN
jgi:hypothetical protein